MRRSSRLIACVGLSMGMLASALVAAPPVLDRVPANAVAVITTPSLSKLHKNADAFMKAVNAPIPIPAIEEILGQMGIEKGIDTSKSIAVAFIPPAGELKAGDEPDPEDMVIIVMQTSGYADLIGNFEAKPGAAGGIDAGKHDSHDVFFKDLGGGFAAMAPRKGTLERFDGKAGAGGAHDAALGKTGQSVVDSADVAMIIYADQAKAFLPSLKEAMKKGMEDGPGGAALGQLENNPITKFFSDTLMNEARSSVTALRADTNGVAIDMTVNFKEGSETAKTLAGAKGGAESLMGHLPQQPYLFAMAMDTSSPGMRKFVDSMLANATKELGGIGQFASNFWKSSDGYAMAIGTPPGGLMAGLFTSTIGYVKTSNADAFTDNIKKGLTDLNGKSMNGLSMETKFEANGGEVEGSKVDTWGIKLKVDENADEEMGQLTMALPMIFGQTGGPGGYMARVDGGLVQTFGKNSALMASAMKVGKGSESMTSDKSLAKVSDQLPKHRVMEMYIGVKSLVESALPLMAMGGMNVDVEVPPSLPPIGMGIGAEDSGAHVGVYLPAATIKTIVAVAQQAQAAQMGGGEPPAGGGPKKGNDGAKARPRF